MEDEKWLYIGSEKIIGYKLNKSEVKGSIDSKDLKSVIKGYGKKVRRKDSKK